MQNKSEQHLVLLHVLLTFKVNCILSPYKFPLELRNNNKYIGGVNFREIDDAHEQFFPNEHLHFY